VARGAEQGRAGVVDASMPDLTCYFPRQGPCSLVTMPHALAIRIQPLQCMARRVMGQRPPAIPAGPESQSAVVALGSSDESLCPWKNRGAVGSQPSRLSGLPELPSPADKETSSPSAEPTGQVQPPASPEMAPAKGRALAAQRHWLSAPISSASTCRSN